MNAPESSRRQAEALAEEPAERPQAVETNLQADRGDRSVGGRQKSARGVEAVHRVPGVIMPFPGGVAGSGSKAGSRYKFSDASTYEAYCPTLRDQLGDRSKVPCSENV